MHSSDEGAEELAGRVGRLVRDHRTAQDLTATELAERSGLSRTILARIERGEGNPSIGTLWRIARALRVPLGSLLGEDVAPRARVVRAGEGRTIDDPSGLVGRFLHADPRERRAEVVALELPVGTRRESPAHQLGVEELLIVTRGSVEVTVDGETHVLRPGDAMLFAADRPHVYATAGRGPCEALNWILYPPAA